MIGGRGAGSAAIVAAFALALFGLAAPVHAQDERPTGFPLSADEDAHGAVTVSAVYTADLRSNVAGGIARGVRYLDNVDLQASIDTDRLLGWRGGKIFLYGLYNNGVSFSPSLVGDIQSVSNVETDVRAARLFEAWVQQDIGRRATVKAGLYNLNSEFDTTVSGGLFLLSSHGIGPDFSQSGRNGPSIFPDTSLVVRGDIRFDDHWLVRAAVLDGVPGDPAHPGRTVIKLSGKDGALLVGEINYLSGGTKVALGGWGYTARFDDLWPAGSAGRGNAGGYAFIERRLTGAYDATPHGLAGWLRVGLANPRFNPVAGYIGGGLVYTGAFPARPADQIGLSIADAELGDRYRRSQALTGDATGAREVIIEAAYRAVLAPWLSLQPDIQYVARPSGAERLADAVVVGLRVKIGR